MPTLIMGASGVAIGEEVILFFCPGGAQALVKGELEKIRDMKLKGLPDPVNLYSTILAEGGRIIFCELALENKGIKVEDLREGVQIMNASSFLLEAQGAGMTLAF
jgi:predicted peroxiredoxin